MKIVKIIYEKDNKDNVFNNCEVIYEDGTREVTNDVVGKIMEFMNQEGLTLANVMNDSRIVNGSIKNDKDKPSLVNDVSGNDVSGNKDDKENNDRRGITRSKNIRKKFIKITAIGTALVVGGTILVDYILDKNKSRTFSNNKSRIEQSIGDDNTFVVATNKPTAKPLVTVAPVVVENSNTQTDDSYNEVFRENVEESIEHIDPLTRNVMRLYNGERLSEDDLLDTVNGINRLCQANMAEVEKLIEGGQMSGDKIFPLFDEMFAPGTIENEVLTSFTSRRNILVDNAYNQDRDLTLSEVNDYNNYFLDFIFGNVTFEHNGKRYGYYDISPIARYIVFMLGQTTLETNHGYSKDINGNLFDFNTIISELEENYNLVTSQLFESGRTR